MAENNLDSVRTVLLKRAFIELKPEQFNPESIDLLLEEQYGKNWKVQYGIVEPKIVEKVSPIMIYTPKKSQQEMNEEFEKKQRAKAREKARREKVKAEKKKKDEKEKETKHQS